MLDLAIDNRIFIYDELDAAIQELDMIFNTENTELIGYPEYGTNWYQFLYQLNPSPNSLKTYIYEKICSTYFLSKFEVDVNVEVLDFNAEGMYQVAITITTENDKKTRIYNI